MSESARQLLGYHLWFEIDEYNRSVDPRRGNVDQWRNDFEMYSTQPSGRWPNSANCCAPLTHIYCQSHHVRLNQQIIQADPPFTVIGKSPGALLWADAIEEALEAILDEAAWDETADEVHADLPVTGNCLVRATYEVKYRRSPRFQYDVDIARFHAFTAQGASPTLSYMNALSTDDQGRPDITLAFEDVLVHAGPCLKMIPWEDSVLLPPTARDPDDCYGFGERLMIRGSELAAGARSGKYIKAEVEAILGRHTDAEPLNRWDRMAHQGITPEPAGSHMAWQDPLYKQFLCYELCWQMDADGDGQMEWVIVTLHWDSKRVLRCQYSPYEHGRPYYVPFGYFLRPRELWAMSVAEKIAGIQDAATAVMNQLIDHGDLVLNLHGNWFYDGTADFNPARHIAAMGQPIKVGSVDGVKLIDVGPIPQEHYNLYQLLKDMADLVTASSNPSLGKTTDTQKTLGEIQIVAGSSNLIFEEHAARVSRCWAKVWDLVRWMAGQFGENGEVKYRVSARPGKFIQGQDGTQIPAAWMTDFQNGGGQMQPAPGGAAVNVIPAEILMAEVDLIPAGVKQLADMQSRVNQASTMQNMALVHPLLMQNLPALAIILEQFMQAIGFPQREKVMAQVNLYVQGIEQALREQAAQGQLGQPGQAPPGQPGQGGPPGGGGGGRGRGPTPASNNPGVQGNQGNPARPPTSPTPPPTSANLPQGRMSPATANVLAGGGPAGGVGGP
jgi:hypothetical protein